MSEADVWRTSLPARVAAWLFIVFGAVGGVVIVGAAVIDAVGGNSEAWWGVLAGFLVGVMFTTGPWYWGVRPFLAATDDGVVVRNPRGSATLIPWDVVADCSVGYDGVTIERRDEDPVTAWAVQKWNLSRWLGRQTRGDHVVARLRVLAASRR